MSEWIFDATAETFGPAVVEKSNDVPVLVDFWADWCEPCKNLTPILESVIEQAAGAVLLAKVDTDKEQAMAMQMGIQSLPTVVLVKGGQIVDSFMGLKSETELKAWLEPHVDLSPAEPEPVVDAGVEGLIAAGQLDAALAQLQTQPVEQVFGQVIHVLLLQGDVEAAQKTFDGLDETAQQSPAGVQALAKIQVAAIDASGDENLLACQQLLQSGQYEVGMERMLEVLAKPGDKDLLKQMLIASFGLLEDPKAVAAYRRRMSRLLF